MRFDYWSALKLPFFLTIITGLLSVVLSVCNLVFEGLILLTLIFFASALIGFVNYFIFGFLGWRCRVKGADVKQTLTASAILSCVLLVFNAINGVLFFVSNLSSKHSNLFGGVDAGLSPASFFMGAAFGVPFVFVINGAISVAGFYIAQNKLKKKHKRIS